jgi:transcription initiation factor TFIIE subunit alpha
MQKDPLELAKVFVKTAVRMFYETEHIVVIDALVFHGALSLPDLVIVLDAGKNQKGAGKLCGKLKESGLLSVYTRQETREGAMKSISREYFYIDYRRAIDATKYKIHIIDERIKRDAKPTTEKAEFHCPQCKAQWTTMEVLDYVDFTPTASDSGFLCKTCNFPLKSINATGEAELENDDTPAKFNRLFKPLLNLMQQIDGVTIPHIEGKDALEGAIELPRDKDINPAAKHEAVMVGSNRPTTVKGINTAPEKIEVSIATDSEYNQAARAAEQEKQAKMALQNQLPDWHTKSTIDTDREAKVKAASQATNGNDTPTIKKEGAGDKKDKDPGLDAVFAALEAEQRRKAEEDEDDEDDDEDEFEDVVASAPTPMTLPDAKRVKLETSAAPTPTNGMTPGASTGDGGDESDEDEFVDV